MPSSKISYSKTFETELQKFFSSDEFQKNHAFSLPQVRDMLAIDRFSNIFDKKIETQQSKNVTAQTILHNTQTNRMFFKGTSLRPDLISKPLSCLNSVAMNAHKMKVLAAGCRTEAEIFSLVDAGFDIQNITGLDLFSYTPLIKIGDVCDLPQADSSFDIVVCGWVLEFISEIEAAVSEIHRVTKPGGLIAIGGMHHPSSLDLDAYNKRKKHESRKWFASVQNILDTFGAEHKDCVFKSDILECDMDKRGEVVVIFRKREI